MSTNRNEKAFNEVLENIQLLCHLQFQGNAEARSPLLDGKPGMAKTALIVEMCKQNNWGLLICKFADQAIEEFTGIPLPQKIMINDKEFDGTTWTISDILTETLKRFADHEQVVVFFDDIHYASATHMQYLHSILDKQIKGHHFPKLNLAFILARNTSSKAGAKIMTSPIINRCKQLPIFMDFTYWKSAFAYKHGVNPKIISFLNNMAYRKFFHEDEQVNISWASPRSWTGFSEELNMYEQFKGGYGSLSDIIYHASGYIGAEAATAFATNYELYSTINIIDIFDKKIEIEIPEDHMRQYILAMAMVTEMFSRYCDEKSNTKKQEETLEIAAQICVGIGNKSSEITVSALKEIVLISSTLNDKNMYFKLRNLIEKLDPKMSVTIREDIAITI